MSDEPIRSTKLSRVARAIALIALVAIFLVVTFLMWLPALLTRKP